METPAAVSGMMARHLYTITLHLLIISDVFILDIMNLLNLHILSVQILFLLVGLGRAFHPDVRWTCYSDSVSIVVQSDDPFEGVIKPRNAKSEDCIARGFGANLSVLKLNFSSKECGILYDESEEVFLLTLEVHSHPVLIVDQDKSIEIRCKRQNSTEAIQHDIRGPLFSMSLLNKDKKETDYVYYGENASLEINSSVIGRNISIGACSVKAVTNTTVDLIDSRGCSRYRNLMSNFERSSSGKGLKATFPSMFRFPGSDDVTVTCLVQFCETICEMSNCMRVEEERTMNLLEDSAGSETEQFSTVTLTFAVKDKRAADVPLNLTPPPKIRASVEARSRPLLAPTEQTAMAAATAEQQCVKQTDVDVLYAVCAILTVCATVGFALNIILCCMIMRRRSGKKERKTPQKGKNPGKNNQFWIMDSSKQIIEEPSVRSPDTYYNNQRNSVMYASVKQKPVQPPILPGFDYGMSHAGSDSSSSYGGEAYNRTAVRHSNSTFMTPSLTMETDIDSSMSSGSHQASSYH